MPSAEQPSPTATLSPTETYSQMSIPDWTITPTPEVTPTLLPIIDKPINQDNVDWFHFQALENLGVIGGVFDIQLDDNDDLLILTSSEIVRFDGNEWTIISENPYLKVDEHNDESMIAFTKDRNGEFWAGSSYGVLYNYDGQKWTSYSLPIDYSGTREGNYIYFIKEDNSGRLWIGSHPRSFQDTGLFSLTDRNIWSSYSRDSDIGSVAINGIDMDPQGNIWVVTDQSIAKIEDEDLVVYKPEDLWGDFFFRGGFSDIEFDYEGNIWLTSGWGWGITKFYNNAATVYSLPEDYYCCPQLYATEDSLWVYGAGADGDSEPLYLFNESEWTHLSGFPFFWVREVLVNDEGLVWLDTELGLYSFMLER